MSNPSIIAELESVIAERKSRPPGTRSYVSTLMNEGTRAIAAKITEEAAEVVAAAAEHEGAGRPHLVHEVADLFFHTLVMLGYHEVRWSSVEAELARRFGLSGLDEKAARGQPAN